MDRTDPVRASWQCEDDPKANRKCLENALDAYKRCKKEELDESKWLTAPYLQIEINRRLSHFDHAMAGVKEMPTDFPQTAEWLYDAVPYQRTLIQAQDSSAKNLNEAPENPRKMELKLAKAKKIKG